MDTANPKLPSAIREVVLVARRLAKELESNDLTALLVELHLFYLQVYFQMALQQPWDASDRQILVLEGCRLERNEEESLERLFYQHGGLIAVISLMLADKSVFVHLDKLSTPLKLRSIQSIPGLLRPQRLDGWIHNFNNSKRIASLLLYVFG